MINLPLPLPYPTTLPYPTLPYSTLPYPTLLYLITRPTLQREQERGRYVCRERERVGGRGGKKRGIERKRERERERGATESSRE